jgi:putative ABC transport system permease protein
MTMSVAERMREFGVMKAVGASPRNLFALTLLETGCLGLLGGMLGILMTAAAGVGIEALLRTFVPFAPSGRLVALGWLQMAGCLAAAMALAAVAGIYPASRAARVRPAQVFRAAA